MVEMNLTEYQSNAVQWLKKSPRAILAGEMGVGKTVIACAAAEKFPLLVVCPAAVTREWAAHIKDWCGVDAYLAPAIKDITRLVTYCVTSPNKAALVISYSMFTHQLRNIRKFGVFKTVILDESHSLKSKEASCTKAAFSLANRFPPDNLWLLSGTIIMNRPIDLWSQMRIIGITGDSYHQFGMQFCDPFYSDFGWQFKGVSNEEELARLLAPYTYSIRKVEALPDLPEKYYRLVFVDGPVSENERAFSLKELRHVNMSTLQEEPLASILAEHGLNKVEFAAQFIRELAKTNDKIFVGAYHSEVINQLYELISPHLRTEVIQGKTTKNKRQKIKDEFQQETGKMVLIGQILATGVGLTLTRANVAVAVEGVWNASQIHQWVDRLHRITQTKPVTAYFLVIRDSIDEAVLKLALKKEKNVNLVMDALHELVKSRNLTTVEPSERFNMNGIFENLTTEVQAIKKLLTELTAKVEAMGKPAGAATPLSAPVFTQVAATPAAPALAPVVSFPVTAPAPAISGGAPANIIAAPASAIVAHTPAVAAAPTDDPAAKQSYINAILEVFKSWQARGIDQVTVNTIAKEIMSQQNISRLSEASVAQLDFILAQAKAR